ncbi:hypothetical protein ACLIL3_015650 [Acinetobacter radioresistens]|jgi:hypothetical protein
MTIESKICHIAKEQVAFDLMKSIAEVKASKDRKYYKPNAGEY